MYGFVLDTQMLRVKEIAVSSKNGGWQEIMKIPVGFISSQNPQQFQKVVCDTLQVREPNAPKNPRKSNTWESLRSLRHSTET